MLKCKKVISCALATMIAMQGGGLVFAGDNQTNLQLNNSVVSNKNHEIHLNVTMNQEQKAFMNKLQKMFGEFELKDGKLALKTSIDELAQKYNLNEFDISIINKMLNRESQSTQSGKNVFVEDWKIYFDNQDLHDYLYAAAGMGPVALLAAFDSLMALFSGPIGLALSTVLDGLALIAGEIYLGDICYKIVYCTLSGKGFYIGWDWSVPKPDFGEW